MTRHREVQGSNNVKFFVCLFFVSFLLFIFFSFACFGLEVCYFVCRFACCCCCFSYGHSKQTMSLLLLDLYYSAWRTICDSYHGFYPRPEKLFHVTDCKKDVVPANTLKRLVRKRIYKNKFSKKLYSEVGFELLQTKKSTIIIRMLYPLSYCN